jgi:hypothetical protein
MRHAGDAAARRDLHAVDDHAGDRIREQLADHAIPLLVLGERRFWIEP